jgi:hypothetical protein
MDIGVFWKNQTLQFAEPECPVFTEKTYAQMIYQKRSKTFLGMIKGLDRKYLYYNKDRTKIHKLGLICQNRTVRFYKPDHPICVDFTLGYESN